MTVDMTEDAFTVAGTVVGMTCQHCVASVVDEVRALPEVRRVSLDLPSGRLSLSAERPIDRVALRDAVAEAGYRLVLADGG